MRASLVLALSVSILVKGLTVRCPNLVLTGRPALIDWERDSSDPTHFILSLRDAKTLDVVNGTRPISVDSKGEHNGFLTASFPDAGVFVVQAFQDRYLESVIAQSSQLEVILFPLNPSQSLTGQSSSKTAETTTSSQSSTSATTPISTEGDSTTSGTATTIPVLQTSSEIGTTIVSATGSLSPTTPTSSFYPPQPTGGVSKRIITGVVVAVVTIIIVLSGVGWLLYRRRGRYSSSSLSFPDIVARIRSLSNFFHPSPPLRHETLRRDSSGPLRPYTLQSSDVMVSEPGSAMKGTRFLSITSSTTSQAREDLPWPSFTHMPSPIPTVVSHTHEIERYRRASAPSISQVAATVNSTLPEVSEPPLLAENKRVHQLSNQNLLAVEVPPPLYTSRPPSPSIG